MVQNRCISKEHLSFRMIHSQFEAFTITQAADGRMCSDRSMPLGVLSETTQHVYKAIETKA